MVKKNVQKLDQPQKRQRKQKNNTVNLPNPQEVVAIGRPETIWPPVKRKKLCMFILNQMIQDPDYLLTWRFWKPVNYFVKMAAYIGDKDSSQCKSYDQRLKNEWKEKFSHMSMIERIIMILKDEFITQNRCPEVVNLLKLFKQKINEDSEAMKFLKNQNLGNSFQRIRDLRMQIKGDKDDIFINK